MFPPLDQRKGVPRRNDPELRRYYEAATVLHLATPLEEQTPLNPESPLVANLQARSPAVAWDFLDIQPSFLRLVYLGVGHAPAEAGRASLQLASALREDREHASWGMAIGSGRLFCIEDPAGHRILSGLLLQALVLLARAGRQVGFILLNPEVRQCLGDLVETEAVPPLENDQGLTLPAFRFLAWKTRPPAVSR